MSAGSESETSPATPRANRASHFSSPPPAASATCRKLPALGAHLLGIVFIGYSCIAGCDSSVADPLPECYESHRASAHGLFGHPSPLAALIRRRSLESGLQTERAKISPAKKDPQFVVIDEVSGQMLTYLPLPLAPLNWKYLLLGFILFRVFDIWKPFPARQAESLPGGWGIMADDWIAGIYAALGLWIARAAGL